MATMISVYFLAIVLVMALGGICDRLEKIADHLHNILEKKKWKFRGMLWRFWDFIAKEEDE